MLQALEIKWNLDGREIKEIIFKRFFLILKKIKDLKKFLLKIKTDEQMKDSSHHEFKPSFNCKWIK